MAAASRIKGAALPFGRANVDTDQIIPSHYLKRVDREGLGEGAFAALRAEPGNLFDDPRWAGAPILIAGANFGCGSSREHAAWALRQFGFEAVLAPSFGEIFEENALRNGLLPLRLAEAEVALLLAEAGEGDVEIDLVEDVVTSPRGERFRFALDPLRKHRLVHGFDEIATTLASEAAIRDYEVRRARSHPWQLGET